MSTVSINQNVVVEDLLIEFLIRESRLSGNDFDEMPSEYFILAKSITQSTKLSKDDEKMWINFGQWLGLKGLIKRKDVRHHLKLTWRRFTHAEIVRKTKVLELPEEIKKIEGKGSSKEKKKLIELAQKNNIKNFRYITNPECIVDKQNKTLVHLGDLNDYNAVNEATKAINSYYLHMLEHPIHRSKSFWKNLTERFGAFIKYTTLPYTSSDMASSHNIAHEDCVNNLLYALRPLTNCINRFINEHYEHYYTKLSKLKLGPFVPRAFGIFPTIAINFNVISKYHWDDNDDPNGLCVLVALGDFEGGELCFPQLQIVVKLKPGQVVIFPSCLLLHGNLPITKGIRFSVVYFVHKHLFLHNKNFDELENEAKNDTIDQPQDFYDAQDLNKSRCSLKNIQKFQIDEVDAVTIKTDKRRYIEGKYIFIKNVFFLIKSF